MNLDPGLLQRIVEHAEAVSTAMRHPLADACFCMDFGSVLWPNWHSISIRGTFPSADTPRIGHKGPKTRQVWKGDLR